MHKETVYHIPMGLIRLPQAKRFQYALSRAVAPLPKAWRHALGSAYFRMFDVPPRPMRNTPEMIQGLRDLITFLTAELGRTIRMVEVGSYAGESTALFATAFHEVTAVDPWWGMPHVERAFDRITKPYHVRKIKGTSVSAAPTFANGSLDFVYIDADHSYESVKEDIATWLPKIKAGGFIGGHDYTPEGEGVMRAVNEVFQKPDITFQDGSWLKRIN